MMSEVYFRNTGPFSPGTNQGNEWEEEDKNHRKLTVNTG